MKFHVLILRSFGVTVAVCLFRLHSGPQSQTIELQPFGSILEPYGVIQISLAGPRFTTPEICLEATERQIRLRPRHGNAQSHCRQS